jgi:hypothetical protein
MLLLGAFFQEVTKELNGSLETTPATTTADA